MELQGKIALLCIINVLWFQYVLRDRVSANYVTSNWPCTCVLLHKQNSNVVPGNCSSSCYCCPAAAGSSKHRWTCICPVNQLPEVVGKDYNNSCFTSCTCNAGNVLKPRKSGHLTELQPSKKRVLGEDIVIVLLSCLILVILSFVASLIWYTCRKDMRSVFWPSHSSDRPSNPNSGKDLICQEGASSASFQKKYSDSAVKSYIGRVPKISFRFRSRTKPLLHGTMIRFSYSELESSTNRFSPSNLIGVGGSSCVYRGCLSDGRTVAIKRMKTQGGPDADQVFMTEIELISRLHHCHVVSLLGYCSEYQGKNAERLLVFDYIPNGNLRECLDGDKGQFLDWSTRVTIALGAARGLEYLHEAAAPRILHRDVKSTNILLDDNWRAKITDLGMAMHLHNDDILSSSSSPGGLQGTFGYFAPEYAIIGRASLKSDVFSFGVVLLELISGRKPIQKTSKGEESLVIWATPRLHNSKRVILELPDPRLKGEFQEEEMQVMAYLAKECLILDPDSRPTMGRGESKPGPDSPLTMGEVVQVLSTIAPDRSRRTNLPGHRSQNPYTSGMRSTNPKRHSGNLCDACASEEIRQITCEMPDGSSPPENLANNFFVVGSGTNVAENTSNYVEKLMLIFEKLRRWRKQDEAVDLTEPKMETFWLTDFDSHIVQIK